MERPRGRLQRRRRVRGGQHPEAADHVGCLIRQPRELERSEYWDPIVRVTRYSDNAAANELLEQTGGSDADGAADMVELMKSLGLTHTYMAGGYLVEGGGGSSLLAVVDQPPTAYKHTTAGDMAALAAMLVDAAAGRGPLLRHGISPHEARELLYLMVHARDAGLVPAVPTACRWPTRSARWTTLTMMWPSFSPTTGPWSSPSTATASRTYQLKRR